MLKAKYALPLLILAVVFIAPRPGRAFEVMVEASILAPNCCFSAKVVAYHSIIVTAPPGPAWYQQPITWYIASDTLICSPYPIENRSFCCITQNGNVAEAWINHGYVPCWILAQAYSEGIVGGYGMLPLRFDFNYSGCIAPCREDC